MDNLDALVRRRSRRSFLMGGLAAAAGIGGYTWVKTRGWEDRQPWPLRRVLELNEKLARGYASDAHLARTYDASLAGDRVNEDIGLDDDIEAEDWRLRVDGGAASRSFTLADIQALPRIDMVTEFKCIEGWSQIMRFTGARLFDIVKLVQPKTTAYVGLETPNGKYYVSLDGESAMHPQTLLSYEMNGAAISDDHGAPLRLAIPVKYGIKNLKRVGRIFFTDEKPKDYWAERGYDWYAGL